MDASASASTATSAAVDSDAMFHALGARVLGAKPHASAAARAAGAPARPHRPLDCLWRDATTGGRVFVGDVTACLLYTSPSPRD